MSSRRAFLSTALCASVAALAPSAHARGMVRLSSLYREDGPTEEALALAGSRVKLFGFMAPPLRAHSTFFVLTATPVSVCPYCEGEDDWLPGIIAIYTPRVFDVRPFYEPLVVDGRLELGGHLDEETGFYSMMRLERAVIL